MKQGPETPISDTKTLTDRLGMLSDVARLRLLRVLGLQELSVGEAASVVQLPQSTVSRHLKLLAAGGWVVRRPVGTASYYRLHLDDLDDDARALWVVVRQQAERAPDAAEDRSRLEGVLAERRLDSQSFFGRVAGEWDEVRQSLFGERFTLLSLLGLVPSDWVVADLGCGTGNASEHLAPFVSRVIAIDQSEPMLEAARKRLASATNVEFRPGSVQDLPLDDASVDAAVSMLVLHHVDEPVDALREAFRVLRPGGVLLLVDMVAHDRREFVRTMGHRHPGFDEETLRTLLSEAGFTDEHVRRLPAEPDSRGPGLFVATAIRRSCT